MALEGVKVDEDHLTTEVRQLDLAAIQPGAGVDEFRGLWKNPFEAGGIESDAEKGAEGIALGVGEDLVDLGAFAGAEALGGNSQEGVCHGIRLAGAERGILGPVEHGFDAVDLVGGDVEVLDEFGAEEGSASLGLEFELAETVEGRFTKAEGHFLGELNLAAGDCRPEFGFGLVAEAHPVGIGAAEEIVESLAVGFGDFHLALGFNGVGEVEEGLRNPVERGGDGAKDEHLFRGAAGEGDQPDPKGQGKE